MTQELLLSYWGTRSRPATAYVTAEQHEAHQRVFDLAEFALEMSARMNGRLVRLCIPMPFGAPSFDTRQYAVHIGTVPIGGTIGMEYSFRNGAITSVMT